MTWLPFPAFLFPLLFFLLLRISKEKDHGTSKEIHGFKNLMHSKNKHLKKITLRTADPFSTLCFGVTLLLGVESRQVRAPKEEIASHNTMQLPW